MVAELIGELRRKRAASALATPVCASSVGSPTALAFGLPLVSNSKKHFARVRGLDLLAY